MLALMCIYFSGCLLFTPARWHFSRVKIQHKGCSSKVFPTLLCHFFPHWSWQRIKWMCWDITGKSDVFLKYIGLFLKILFIYFYTEGKGGRKRGRETSMCGCLSHTATGGLPHNPAMCPDRESNQWPFGLQSSTQSTEPHQPGHIGDF